MQTIGELKQDLRAIKNYQHTIDTYKETRTKYEERLTYLLSAKKNDSVLESIEKIKIILNNIKDNFNENKLIDLEKKYMNALSKLKDETDKAIILKVYIQGKTYYRTSMEMNYSYEAIKKKLKSALRKLLFVLNSEE